MSYRIGEKISFLKKSTNDKVSKPTVDEKHLLQYSHSGRKGEAEVIIGLDFGTSASKVVIQLPELPGKPSYVVDFGDYSHPSANYLLPTKLWVTTDGKCSLPKRADAFLIDDIKLNLFSKFHKYKKNNDSHLERNVHEEYAVSYLALLLRYVREWFLREKVDIVGNFKELIWNVNLGVPSPCVEDNEENRCFRRVGKAAWMLSVMKNNITLDVAEQELRFLEKAPDYWENDNDGYVCDFDIIPEIAAGAVGYAMSDLRRDGLHVMIDIGASTVDACCFNLNQADGSDRYSLFMSDVQVLGTVRLHYERIMALKTIHEKKANELRENHDPMLPIAENAESYLVPENDILSEIELAEKRLEKELKTMLKRVIWKTKLHKYRNAKEWKQGKLPLLIIGGGSEMSIFSTAVHELDYWLESNTQNDGTKIVDITLPETLKREKADFKRIAVAWGLSHRSINIGEITPADKIPDEAPPTKKDWEKNYVSKDQV